GVDSQDVLIGGLRRGGRFEIADGAQRVQHAEQRLHTPVVCGRRAGGRACHLPLRRRFGGRGGRGSRRGSRRRGGRHCAGQRGRSGRGQGRGERAIRRRGRRGALLRALDRPFVVGGGLRGRLGGGGAIVHDRDSAHLFGVDG